MLYNNFILFEGIDCQGKSTQERNLKNYLEERIGENKVKMFQEKSFSEKYWKLILDDNTTKIEEFFLFLAQRKFVSQNVTKPILQNTETQDIILLQDRQIDSTMVYQYYTSLELRNQISQEEQKQLNVISMSYILPKLTFYFTVDLDIFVKRCREKTPDKLDSYQFDRFNEISEHYDKLYKSQEYLNGRKIVTINTTDKSENDVLLELTKQLRENGILNI